MGYGSASTSGSRRSTRSSRKSSLPSFVVQGFLIIDARLPLIEMAFGEHSSKGIIGTKSEELKGKKIILCITGSVAAIKSTEIARELMRRGAEVYAVMTKSSQQIVHPDMVEWATGNPVVTELTGKIEHVTYAGEHPLRADLILVAPSTANTIGKVACGIDDTPVTTTLTTGIGAGIPVIIAPAMHASARAAFRRERAGICGWGFKNIFKFLYGRPYGKRNG